MTSSYALTNIILAFLTGLAALVFLFQREEPRIKQVQHRRVRIAKTVALLIAITSCLICIFAENVYSEIVWVDKWTLILTIMFFGELYADYYVYKRCHYKVTEEA